MDQVFKEFGNETACGCDLIKESFTSSSKKVVSEKGLELIGNVNALESLPLKRNEDMPGGGSCGTCCMPSSSSSTGNAKTRQEPVKVLTLQSFKTQIVNLKWPISYGITLPLKNFTGLEQELNKLNSFYKNKQNLVLVCGFDEIGRTELCRKFMQIVIKRAFCFGLLDSKSISRVWLQGDSFESFKSSVLSLACELGEENDEATPSQMFEYLIKIVLRHSKNLVVVIDSVDAKFNEVHEVIKMVRTYENVFVIVTSRNRMILDNAGETLLLDVLSQTKANNFVQNCINNLSDSEVDSLCKLVQNFPLALQQAVAYIKVQRENFKTSSYSVSDYVKEFEDKKLEMLDQGLNEHDSAMTTLVTCDITFKKLNEDASGVLKVLSFLEPDTIGFDFLKQICVEFFRKTYMPYEYVGFDKKFDDALNILEKYSLIKIKSSNNLSIERFVQAVMRQKVGDEFFDEIFHTIWDVVTHSALLYWNFNELPHLRRIIQLTQHDVEVDFTRPKFLRYSYEFVYYFQLQIAFKLYIKNEHKDSLKLYEELLSSKHNSVHEIAFYEVFHISKTNSSLLVIVEILENLLERRKESLDGDDEFDETTRKIKLILAVILDDCGESARSLDLFGQIKSYYDANPPKFDVDLLEKIILQYKVKQKDFYYLDDSYHEYSFDYDYVDFEGLQRLFKVYKNVFGENHDFTAGVKLDMALKLCESKEYAKSLELWEQIIIRGDRHSLLKAYETMHKIGVGLCFEGFYHEGRGLMERVIQFYEDSKEEVLKYCIYEVKESLADTLVKLDCDLSYAMTLYLDVLKYKEKRQVELKFKLGYTKDIMDKIKKLSKKIPIR